MTIPKRQRLLGILALLCAGLFLADRFVVTPVRTWHRVRQREIVRLSMDIRKGEGLIAQHDRLAATIQDFRRRQAPADPSEAEHQLLTSLRHWADDSGVTIESVRPRRLAERNDLEHLEVRVAARGSMEALAKLMYDVETESRPISIQKLALSAPRNGDNRLGASFSILLLLAQTDSLIGESAR